MLQAAVLPTRHGGRPAPAASPARIWVRELDFGSLEKVGGNSGSPTTLREPRAATSSGVSGSGASGCTFYLLIEFQSTVDRYLAVRVLSYVGMLYEDFIRTGELTTTDGRLPAVLPIVLYERATQWDSRGATVRRPGTVARLPCSTSRPGRVAVATCAPCRRDAPRDGRAAADG